MKKDTIIFWITTGMIFVLEGVMSAIYGFSDTSRAAMVELGYPMFFGYSVAIAKILGSIALITPQAPHWSKEWAYAGFTFMWIAATVAHYLAADGIFLLPVALIGSLAVSYVTRPANRRGSAKAALA